MRALASMLVELLPLEAWLLVFAAYQGVPINQAAAPFWALLAAMALAWWIARSRRGTGQRATLSAGVVPFVLAYLVLLRVSPAAYGDTGSIFDLSWLGTLANDFATSSHRVSSLFGLLLLLALIWWRGTALGVDLESISGDLRRFTLFFGALLLALVGAVAARPETQDALSAALTLVLLAEVFVGLVDASLARVATVRREGYGGAREAPWVRTSLALAAGVIGVALLVSVVFNFNSFLVLLSYLGPVGGAISFVLTWLIDAFANLLGKLLTPIILPFKGKIPLPHFAPLAPVKRCHVSGVNGVQICPHPTQTNGLLDLMGHVFNIVGVLVVIVLIVFVTRLALSKRHPTNVGDDEDREALDARSLLAAQLRGMFARRQRRGRRTEETLPRDSVRYLYREMLRAAHVRGLDRRSDETPDEFAGRLGKTAPIAMFSTTEGSDLLALSDAYDDARYADREPDPGERARLQAGAARLARLLRGQERERR